MNRFTNWRTGGRLIDLTYIYSITTLALGIAGFYMWTRYWYLFQTDERRLLVILKYYLVAYVITWILAVSRSEHGYKPVCEAELH